MTVKIDLKSSSRLRLDKNGYRAERIAQVSGVTGNIDALLYNALNDAGLPNVGDVHPVIDNITLQTIETVDQGGGNYRVVMSYFNDLGTEAGIDNARYKGRVNASTEVIYRDRNGDVMQTEYLVEGLRVSEYFPAEIERAMLIMEFEYTDPFFPQAEINKYMGKINSTPWLGYAENTIYLAGISVDDQGENYSIKFSFQYNPETWIFSPTVAYHYNIIEAHPDRPDADLDLDSGTKDFEVYETVDFSPLGFKLTGPLDFQAGGGAFIVAGSPASLVVA